MGKKSTRTKRKKARKHKDIYLFTIRYVIFTAFFLLLIGYKPIKNFIDFNGIYTNFIVKTTAFILKPLSIIRSTHGSLIYLKGITLDVKFGCNGLEAFLIYAAGILSFPAPQSKKIKGLIAGLLIIQILNIIRIAALSLSGIYLKKYFHYIHVYIAQGIMIAVALIVFLFWLNYASQE